MVTSMRRLAFCLATLFAIGLTGASNAQEPNETQSYDVSALNLRLKNEAGLSQEESRTWIESRVWPMIRFKHSQLAIATLVEIAGKEVPSDSTRRGTLVVADQLHVIAPKDEQKQVKEFVDTFTRFGVRQIEIRTLVVRDTAEAMKSLPIRWSHVEATSQIADSSAQSNVKQASLVQAPAKTAAARFIESQKPLVKEDLPPPEGVTSATWTEATSIVERSTPVLYSLLSPKEHEAVMAHSKKQETLQRIMSPSVVVFNGQIASMSNATERPFVTGIKVVELGPENKKVVEFAPNVKVYQEGTTMKIRPELKDGKSVRLNCQLDLCKIRSVETQSIPGIESRGDFKIQMPEVAKTQFRTCMEMPIDYTLAVSAFETDETGAKHSVVILCQCSVRDIEAK